MCVLDKNEYLSGRELLPACCSRFERRTNFFRLDDLDSHFKRVALVVEKKEKKEKKQPILETTPTV